MTNSASSIMILLLWYLNFTPQLIEKYYYPSKLGEDLEAGFDEFIKHEEIDEHLDGLLNSLQHYEESSGKEVKVDIVTWRGMMTKIMTVKNNQYVTNCRHRFQETILGR